MQLTTNLSPEEAYKKRKISFAVQGLFLAWISSLTAVCQGNINGMVSSALPLSVEKTAIVFLMLSLSLLAINDFIAGVWILIYNLATGRSLREYFRVGKTKIGAIMLLSSFFGGPFATGCWMAAVNLCGLTYTIVIISLSPILTALVGRVVFKERMNARIITGIVIAVVGVVLASFSPPTGDRYPYFYLGIFLAALAPIGFTVEGMLSTYVGDIIDPNVGCSLYRSIGSGLMGFIVIIIVGNVTGVGMLGIEIVKNALTTSQGNITIWVFVMALCAGASYLTTYVAFNKSGPTRTLAVVNTMPVWSIPIGLLFAALGLYPYTVTTQAIIGAFVTLFGITLVVANPKELVNLRDV